MRGCGRVEEARGCEVARDHGIPIVGDCGILLKAKQVGLIEAVGPVLQSWKTRIGYHLSETLVIEVLHRAGEVGTPRPE